MSMELGTYTQGEYVPRQIEKRTALGSTKLEFSSRNETLVTPEATTIFTIEDPELDTHQVQTLMDSEPSYARSQEDFQLLRRLQRTLNRRVRRNKNRR